MAKQLDLTKILEAIKNLPTKDQLKVIDDTQKILDEKSAAAEAELSMIKNNGK